MTAEVSVPKEAEAAAVALLRRALAQGREADPGLPVALLRLLCGSLALSGRGEKNRAKTRCPRGHLYAGDNLYTSPSGKRYCIACRRLNSRSYRLRLRRRRLAEGLHEKRRERVRHRAVRPVHCLHAGLAGLRGVALMEEKEPMSVAEAGRKGGKATAAKHGSEFYQSIGRLGGQRVRQLIEAGKQAVKEEEDGEPLPEVR